MEVLEPEMVFTWSLRRSHRDDGADLRVPARCSLPLGRPIGYNPFAPPRVRTGLSRSALGEVAERLNAAVSKTVGPRKRSRGFESPPLRIGKLKASVCGPGRSGRVFASLGRVW